MKLGTSNLVSFVCLLIHRSTNACMIYYPKRDVFRVT